MLETVLDNRTGQVIISALLGMGIAIMFSRACSGRNCMVIRGPNPASIEGKIYQFNNECYSFKPHMTSCSADTKPVKSV